MSEPGNKEILSAINILSAKVDSNSEAIKSHSESIDSISEAVQALASHVDEIHTDLHSEISSLRFDMNHGFAGVESMFREEDKKIDRLTEKLIFRKVISKKDTKEVLALGPFPVQGAKTNSR